MNKQLLLLGIFFHCFGLIAIAQKPALFYRIGLELGGSGSNFVPKQVYIPQYNSRLGGRLGVFAMHRLWKSLDLKTGIFYKLRGVSFSGEPNPYDQSPTWNLHSITFPLMLFYHLSSRVNIALGVEINAVTNSNLPISSRGVDLGVRGSCGYYIVPRCRVAAYYTVGFGEFRIYSSSSNATHSYTNIIGGFSVAYELYQRKDYSAAPPFIHPCPRF